MFCRECRCPDTEVRSSSNSIMFGIRVLPLPLLYSKCFCPYKEILLVQKDLWDFWVWYCNEIDSVSDTPVISGLLMFEICTLLVLSSKTNWGGMGNVWSGVVVALIPAWPVLLDPIKQWRLPIISSKCLNTLNGTNAHRAHHDLSVLGISCAWFWMPGSSEVSDFGLLEMLDLIRLTLPAFKNQTFS